jgi:dsDNA-binding SOS-regulon protein
MLVLFQVKRYGEEKAKQLKQKRSENFKKIVNAAEFRNRLLIVHKNNKGRKLSQETKEKMSKSHMGEKNHFYGKKHSEETKKLIGSKSKNRNWFRGYVIKIDEKIFFEIIINLTFKQSVFKEISEKYKTKTGQKIGKKTILKFGIKCGVPFRTAKGAKALNNIKDFVINYKKNKTELNESQ